MFVAYILAVTWNDYSTDNYGLALMI